MSYTKLQYIILYPNPSHPNFSPTFPQLLLARLANSTGTPSPSSPKCLLKTSILTHPRYPTSFTTAFAIDSTGKNPPSASSQGNNLAFRDQLILAG